jgi:hypothetical protein
MNSTSWLHYYERNRLNRPEPEWDLAFGGDPVARQRLARSLSHFQLGESGDGTYLLAQARRAYFDDPDYCSALALFIQEEQEHARLLRRLVERYSGRLVSWHWTHSLFRGLRQACGAGFEIQVLVIAEFVGTAYYRLLGRNATDPVLRHVCEILLRDEDRHIAFHAERMAANQAPWLPLERALWVAQFQVLFLVALRAAWLDHGPALQTLGVRSCEFRSEARRECLQFLAGIGMAPLPEPSTPAPGIAL